MWRAAPRLWAADAEAMSASLQLHDDILRQALDDHGGYVFTTAGDAFCAAFQRASDAVAAAVRWPAPSGWRCHLKGLVDRPALTGPGPRPDRSLP